MVTRQQTIALIQFNSIFTIWRFGVCGVCYRYFSK
nr:MAG TPA: hypothetical protein [Caudoviricetes sp.]DAT22182.1 MAG TPA: hypothetical protein [Caudoviricetes sp.]